MPVHTSAVGCCLNKQQVCVDKRCVLAFAAVLGETSSKHFDDARATGIVALPQFCVSIEWPLASAAETAAKMGLAADEAVAAIHLRQDSVFHEAIRPGDRLLLSTTLTGARATGKGAIVQSRTETISEATGAKIVTTWSEAIFLGASVNGDDVVAANAPPKPAEDLPETVQRIPVKIARELPHLYTECAQIWNPIHTEREVALAAGLPDIILHGTATWSIAGRELVRHYAEGDSSRLKRLGGSFAAPVIPGHDVTIEHVSSKRDKNVILFRVRNHEGAVSIRDGVAEFYR